MPTVSVESRNVAGTEAALGCVSAHTIVVDRPEGHVGGRGLGFNGAQLLALHLSELGFRRRYEAYDQRRRGRGKEDQARDKTARPYGPDYLPFPASSFSMCR
jgi:hypothetical protein